jgi:hypothetical protein
MKRPEAEMLLGGHAAGILTDLEKQRLFRAALEHQELFDALMDEEALRELLAEPETRRRLLALLAGPEPVALRPLWRRPAVLGLAASLFLVVTTSLVLLRRPEGPVLLTSMQESDKEAAPAQGAPQTRRSVQAPAAPAPTPGKPVAARKAKGAEPPQEAAAQGNLEEAGPQATGPAKSLAAGVGAAPPPLREVAMDAAKAEAGIRAPSPAAEAKRSNAAPAPRKEAAGFMPVLEHLGGGRYRLTVGEAEAGYLYVLKRSPAGAVLLTPLPPATPAVAVFEVTLGAQEALDVYLLRLPQEAPTALPAAKTVPGEWRRLFPQ